MGKNMYDEPWSLHPTQLQHEYLERELEKIDLALGHALDALESSADLDQKREAYKEIQDLYEPGKLMQALYPHPPDFDEMFSDNEDEKSVVNTVDSAH